MTLRHHLAEDTIDRDDIEALVEWLRQEPRLTKGPLTPQFEAKWSAWLGRKHSLFCNSGSSANLLMYYALHISGRLRNLKVVVPSVGWATTVAPAIQFGFTPLMCEADKKTFALDPDHLDRLCREHQPAAVILVQVLGVPAEMEPLLALKEKYGFLLMEDACAAYGSKYRERLVGSFGDLASFSLYFGHQMSTIEGGMISTDDKELHDLLLMLRSHGWSKDLDRATHDALVAAHGIDDFHTPFVFYEPGFNLRSTDLNAFLGLRQIDRIDWIIERRSSNHARYVARLGDLIEFQQAPAGSTVCSISAGALARDREERRSIVKALAEEGIETRIFSAGNLGLHPFWVKRYGVSSFPMADRIHHCGFFLPNHPYLEERDVDEICGVVSEAVRRHRCPR